MTDPALLLQNNLDSAAATLRALPPLADAFGRAVDLVTAALSGGKKLLVCGNGGSAADAMHFATEFVCRFVADRRPYPAICLNISGGDLTAIGNDYKFEEIFARQVRAFGQRGDVLVVFTTSGQSENVRRALAQAEALGLSSIAFLGRDGGTARGLATVDLLVPGTESARIQEAHKVLLHTLCEAVEERIPKE